MIGALQDQGNPFSGLTLLPPAVVLPKLPALESTFLKTTTGKPRRAMMADLDGHHSKGIPSILVSSKNKRFPIDPTKLHN
jgi:hypothetical protein